MDNASRTILLVEDEILISELERRKLSHSGYEVVPAFTGEEAIASVAADPDRIDLVLMDIDLGPGIDGAEVAKEIYSRYEIPVLFLSSHTEPSIVAKTEKITNYGYVVKSSPFAVLDASIKMAFKLFEAQARLNASNLKIKSVNDELRKTVERLEATNEALRISEEKFSKAFRLSPDAVNINRLSDGLYIDINEGFTRIMGYSKQDVLGRTSLPGDLSIWVRPEDRSCLIQRLRSDGEVLNFNSEFRRKDGTLIAGAMSARIIEIEGETCIISVTRAMEERVMPAIFSAAPLPPEK